MDEITRVVIYARVSTEDQAKNGYSLQSQVEACEQYVDQHGWHLVDTIIDDGISGATLDRPGLDRVMEMAKASVREFDVLLVYDLDRLARKAVYHQIIEMEMAKYGIEINYVRGDYANTDEGRLTKTILAGIAEYERAKILERNLRGKRTKARNGKIIGLGKPPLGYRFEDGYYYIVDEEAVIVRNIFDWYLNGASLYEICKRLENRGILTARGKSVWQPSTVKGILQNETYYGTMYQNRWKTMPNKTIRVRPRSEWIPVQVPQIIPDALWKAVESRLDHNRQVRRKPPKRNYLVRGMLKCTNGNHLYAGVSSKGHIYYRDFRGGNRSLRGDTIEESIWQTVRKVIEAPNLLTQGTEELQKDSPNEQLALEKQLDAIDDELKKFETQKARLLDAYLDLEFPLAKADYIKRNQQLDSKISQLHQERHIIETELEADQSIKTNLDSLITLSEQVKDGLSSADFQTKRELLELLNIQGQVTWAEDKKSAEIMLHGMLMGEGVGLSYITSSNSVVAGLNEALACVPALLRSKMAGTSPVATKNRSYWKLLTKPKTIDSSMGSRFAWKHGKRAVDTKPSSQ